MIGAKFKKYAAENGLSVSNGVAYGDFRGYAATLSEGSGWKLMVISTKFPEFSQKNELQNELNGLNLQKTYNINQLSFLDDGIVVNFTDTIKTMEKIKEFVDFFFPLLDKYGAIGANVCPHCGQEFMGDGKWKLVNGVAMHLHEGCAQQIAREADTEETAMRESDTGSYGKGALGALVGSLIGAIPWAIIQYFGYIASVFGLVIGLLAKKFYELFHGKNGKAKVAIIAVCAIIGVIVGNFASDVIYLIINISNGEIGWVKMNEIPQFIAFMFATDSEYRAEVIKNILIGIAFALLGMFALLRGTKQETAGFKMIDLM